MLYLNLKIKASPTGTDPSQIHVLTLKSLDYVANGSYSCKRLWNTKYCVRLDFSSDFLFFVDIVRCNVDE